MAAPVRIRLLEADADAVDSRVDSLASSIEKVGADMSARLGKIQWAIISLLISIITGIAVFIITLGAGGHL
jgi:tetrahydromethanopterin S-methyltransferase subunit G